MSKYTTELRWVMEQALDDLGLSHDESNWNKCWKVVGLDDYPLYDETHRDALNTKIVRHYYTREIGSETVGRWRMFVREAMHSVMPYYNQLYESEVKVKGIDFMTDHDLNITQAVEGTEKKSETGTEKQSAEGTEKRSAEGTENSTADGTEKKGETGTEKKTETGTEKQVDTGSSKSASESSQTGHAVTTTDNDTTVTGDSWNTSDSTDTNVFSDTPQSEMVPDQIKDMKYASNVTIDSVHSEAKAGSRNVTDGTTTVTADDTSSASGSGTGSYDNSSNKNTTDELSRTTSSDLSRTTKDTLDKTTTDTLDKATTDDMSRNTTDDMSRNTTDDLTRHEVGVLSSRANLLKEWRENMLNIDYMVVHDRELRECFMMVW